MPQPRRLLASLLSLSAGLLLTAAEPSANNALRLNLTAQGSDLKVITVANSAGESFGTGAMTWLAPDLRQRGAFVCGPADRSHAWKHLTLTVRTAQDDTVTLSLMGTHTDKTLTTLYDAILIDGQPVPNGGFEDGLRGWLVADQASMRPQLVADPGLVRDGKRCLRASHDASAAVRFRTIAGRPAEIRLAYCVEPPPSLPADFNPLDLTAAVNRDFADARPDDQTGGWTDQGPENDLSCFDLTRHRFGDVGFQLIDPARNGGRAVAVFDSEHLATGLTTLTVPIGRQAKFLYLLHTSAWNHYPAGSETARVTVTDETGKETAFPIRIGQELVDWWLAGDLPNARVVYRRPASQGNAGLFISKFRLPDAPLRTLRVDTAGKGIYLLLAASVSDTDVRLNFDDLRPGKDYRPIDFIDVNYLPGTALDLSRLNTPNAFEVLGPVRRSADGTFLEFANRPGVPARFRATYHFPRPQAGLTTEEKKAGIDRYVRNIARAGYNMVRTHIIDCFAKGNNRNDFEYDPENIDLIDYFIFRCRQAGIYINYNTGAYQLSVKERAFTPGFPPIKQLMMFGDERVRKSWLAMTQYLLHRRNPYTGLTMAEDPALVLVEPFNELGLAFNLSASRPHPRELILQRFGDFLARKHAGATVPKPQLPPFNGHPELAPDWEEFRYETSREAMTFMLTHTRQLGYRGLFAQYNAIKTLGYAAINEQGPDLTISNSYFCHPSKFDRPGSVTPQTNPFSALCPHFLWSAAQHAHDKPIITTEYNTAWGNQFKYADIMYTAYAALNGFSGLTRHETMNDLWRTKTADTFGSIVDRPLETIAAFLFQRGDVSAARNRLILEIPEAYATTGRTAGHSVSTAQSRLALVFMFTTDILRDGEPKPVPRPRDVRLPITGAADVTLHDWFVSQQDGSAQFDAAAFVRTLRERKLLAPDNLTNPELGLWQSDTQELLLDASAGTFTVRTPKSEAATGAAHTPFALDTLHRLTSSVPATISIHSLQDDKPLRDADHLLLIYLTTAMNTDMARSYDSSRLVSNGKLPVLLQTGTLQATLRLKPNQTYALFPLANNGLRRDPIPLRADADGLATLTLDTAQLPHGPTFYFELVRQQTP